MPALYLAQIGRKHPDAKPLTGIEGGVLEVVEDFNKNTYRAVYKVQLGDVVYVLNVFQKKSKSGKATPSPRAAGTSSPTWAWPSPSRPS